MTNLHVIVGAGATGSATAQLLAERGEKVRVISRSGSGPVGDGIERVAADATDSTALVRLSTDAAALYNCANPPYHRWATDWPPLADSLIDAAKVNDAVLVTLSNLYGYSAPTGPMTTDDPLDPPSKKGAVRAAMWKQALAAHQAGEIRMTEARASDFIGPGVGENGHMGDRVIPRVLDGKSVSVFGRTDVLHSWSAIDDVARTLVTIATDERAWGQAWHVPSGAPLTQHDLVQRIAERAGTGPIKVRSMPQAALRVAGLFMAQIRELNEMLYQFDAPFVIDASATTDTFGIEPTPLDDTLAATIAGYRA